MSKLKIFSIFGTRPEAIKMAPLVSALKKHSDIISSKVLVTAQHREMLDQFLHYFSITPDYDLNIMKKSQTLSEITCRALAGVEDILKDEKPDLILVQGDTTTVFAASLAAFYQKIKIGHVEAGLRTDDKYNPFPEEINRRLASVLADLHFAPTRQAKENLIAWGCNTSSIFLTGNTVIDSLYSILEKTEDLFELPCKLANENCKILFVEAHRRENLGKPMENICEALLDLIENYDETEIVFPVHKNPLVRETVFKYLMDHNRIHLIEPLDYPEMVNLQKKSYLILTDSGGIQEEAPALGKPVLVLRRTTERPEGIEMGTSRLVGTDRKNIYREASALIRNNSEYLKMSRAVNPYGDGKASTRIIDAILYYFGISDKPPDELVINQ